MKTVSYFKKYSLYTAIAAGVFFTSCDDDDVPEIENELEVITDVVLIFTNEDDPEDVVEAHAEDPDGEGIEGLEIMDEITLDVDKTYTLTFDIENALAEEEEEEEHDEEEEDEEEHGHGADITEEIAEEDDEHQLFFSFTSDVFADPTGEGNIGEDATGTINYNDEDENGNPVGLSTSWTTSSTSSTDGTFTVRLQHQPDLKTATSTSEDGDTDFELTFVLNIN